MLRTTLIRTLTLISFASLIILFLLYRSGRLFSAEKELQTSHNGGVLVTARQDSLPKKTNKRATMLPSSKTMVLVDEEEKMMQDSLKQKKEAINFQLPKDLLSSTKSTIIFSPTAKKNKIFFDSLYRDTTLLKTKKKK